MKPIAHKRKSDNVSQPLETHLLEVGKLSARFAEKIGQQRAGRLLGLLHDFGKYSKEFQDYIKSATGDLDKDDADFQDVRRRKGKIDHSSAGAQYVFQQLIKNSDNSGENDRKYYLVGQMLALCIASHHSGLIDCIDKDGKPKFKQRMDKDDDLTHLKECSNVADKSLISDNIDQLINAETVNALYQMAMTVVGLSGKQQEVTQAGHFNLGFLARFMFSCLIDADRLNSAEFETPSRQSERTDRQFSWKIAIERCEQFIANLTPAKPIDHLRQKISDDCCQRAAEPQGMYTLTVPTGGGKTYASLRYALHHAAKHELDRVIYIIPYTSIIDQNATEIRNVLEQPKDDWPWVLEQHSNLDPEKQNWRNKLVAENWDSPIVLTTMVQFLEVCFSGGTRSVRRLHQLANSVLIFDEIQTLPIKCTYLFCGALNFLVKHARSTAVLCTATQPLLNRLPSSPLGQLDIPSGNELAHDVTGLFEQLNRVELKNCRRPGGYKAAEIVELAIKALHGDGNCLVIVNTKAWAQELYTLCQQEITDEAVLFHMSTNQCPEHRKHILNKIRQRLKDGLPVLCISTQLVEAGVDISFANVVRFLAGLDSIAQAAGRCNRHGELRNEDGTPRKGTLYLIEPDTESTGMLKDIEEGKRNAARVLDENFEDIFSTEAISRYFDYYFYGQRDAMDYKIHKRDFVRDDTLLSLLSDNRNCPVKKNSYLLSQSFMEAGRQFKAIDAPTQAVIVPYEAGKCIRTALCGADKIIDSKDYYGLLRKAQRYSVNVFPNVWKKLQDAGTVHEIQLGYGIYYLNDQYYSEQFGLTEQSVNKMGAIVL